MTNHRHNLYRPASISGRHSRRTGRTILLIIGTCLFGFFCIAGLVYVRAAQSARKADDAVRGFRLALAAARDARADEYAPRLYEKAARLWDSTMAVWSAENRKWAAFRNIDAAREIAAAGVRIADSAENSVAQARDSLKNHAFIRMTALHEEVSRIRRDYNDVPMGRAMRVMLASGEMLLSECRSAFDRGEFALAAAKADKAFRLCTTVGSHTSSMVEEYLRSLPQWDAWVRETIAWTKQKKAPAVIVVKMDRVCRVYNNGRMVSEFAIELGPNWMRTKCRQGDDATPEGRYSIIARRSGNQTKYGWALVINYPNDEDRRRFVLGKRRGEIDASARIGGAVEIHGGGGRSSDWTDGCVALVNDDMQALYRMASVGTPVTIVGAYSKEPVLR
jgi:L,D-peptidoglycan transpeptidase YkuD (ErfK/YbiS/YcfS/YnhG family)